MTERAALKDQASGDGRDGNGRQDNEKRQGRRMSIQTTKVPK